MIGALRHKARNEWVKTVTELTQRAQAADADLESLYAAERAATNRFLHKKGISPTSPKRLAPMEALFKHAGGNNGALVVFAQTAETPRTEKAQRHAVHDALSMASRAMVYGLAHQASAHLSEAADRVERVGSDKFPAEAIRDLEAAQGIVSALRARDAIAAANALVTQLVRVTQRPAHHDSRIQIPTLRACLARTLGALHAGERFFPDASLDGLMGRLVELLANEDVYEIHPEDGAVVLHALYDERVDAPTRYDALAESAHALRNSRFPAHQDAARVVQLLADSTLHAAVTAVRNPDYAGTVPARLKLGGRVVHHLESKGRRAFAQFQAEQIKAKVAPPYTPRTFMQFIDDKDILTDASNVELMNMLYGPLALPSRA